eukprot:1188032-Prorocentrum_minimum.AAC.2
MPDPLPTLCLVRNAKGPHQIFSDCVDFVMLPLALRRAACVGTGSIPVLRTCKKGYGSPAAGNCVKCYHPVLNALYIVMAFLINVLFAHVIIKSALATTKAQRHRYRSLKGRENIPVAGTNRGRGENIRALARSLASQPVGHK